MGSAHLAHTENLPLMHTSIEGVCGNNAVQFQSCVFSSYYTALGENGCTDIISYQLQEMYSCQISASLAVPILQNCLPYTFRQFWHHQGRLASTVFIMHIGSAFSELPAPSSDHTVAHVGSIHVAQ